ncbi:MAG: hypothetical protein C0168_01220 [Candidatus Aminicenantes bacterium]|nr:MAG: hypothetical protein C0168_01220 [Candidatus Aminicenantes bacterium]
MKNFRQIDRLKNKWGTLFGVPFLFRGIVRGKRFMIEGGLSLFLNLSFAFSVPRKNSIILLKCQIKYIRYFKKNFWIISNNYLFFLNAFSQKKFKLCLLF